VSYQSSSSSVPRPYDPHRLELPEDARGPYIIHVFLDPYRKEQIVKGLRLIKDAEMMVVAEYLPDDVLDAFLHRAAEYVSSSIQESSLNNMVLHGSIKKMCTDTERKGPYPRSYYAYISTPRAVAASGRTLLADTKVCACRCNSVRGPTLIILRLTLRLYGRDMVKSLYSKGLIWLIHGWSRTLPGQPQSYLHSLLHHTSQIFAAVFTDSGPAAPPLLVSQPNHGQTQVALTRLRPPLGRATIYLRHIMHFSVTVISTLLHILHTMGQIRFALNTTSRLVCSADEPRPMPII
jgi:hypothetical protein